MDRTFGVVCLSVCLSAYCPKTNNPKVFKLGTGNDHWITSKWHDFEVERSKVKVRVRVRVQQYGVGSNSMSA